MDKVNLLFYDTSDSSEIFLFKSKDSRFLNQYFSIRVRQKKLLIFYKTMNYTEDVVHLKQILCRKLLNKSNLHCVISFPLWISQK